MNYPSFNLSLALSLSLSLSLSPQLFGNIWLSMASLVIFMQLRYLFHEVQRRLRRHKNYLRVIDNMEARSALSRSSSHLLLAWLYNDPALGTDLVSQ